MEEGAGGWRFRQLVIRDPQNPNAETPSQGKTLFVRRLSVWVLLGWAGMVYAQAPDVTIKLDARLNYRSAERDANTQRMYDALGNYSIVSLSFKLEPGFRVYVGQKLQRFNGDKDNDLLDEYYIEDEGIWRAGKQYLPFGANRLVRESVFAARGDTNLLVEGLPIAAAYAQGEKGRQKGIVGRIGGRLGFSVFYGDHFGIDGTTLAYIRKPEHGLGKGRGFRQAYALDYSKGVGDLNVAIEAVAFRDGHRTVDEAFEAFDLSATYTPSPAHNYTLGWTHRTNPSTHFLRAQANIFLTNRVYLEPMVRYQDGNFYDFNVAVRVRL